MFMFIYEDTIGLSTVDHTHFLHILRSSIEKTKKYMTSLFTQSPGIQSCLVDCWYFQVIRCIYEAATIVVQLKKNRPSASQAMHNA